VKVKSAEEIYKEIEEQARDYMWGHIWENVEEILVNWEKDIREDERKKYTELEKEV
jgi:hypothetical protein